MRNTNDRSSGVGWWGGRGGGYGTEEGRKGEKQYVKWRQREQETKAT